MAKSNITIKDIENAYFFDVPGGDYVEMIALRQSNGKPVVVKFKGAAFFKLMDTIGTQMRRDAQRKNDIVAQFVRAAGKAAGPVGRPGLIIDHLKGLNSTKE
jgi:hypothetical protein